MVLLGAENRSLSNAPGFASHLRSRRFGTALDVEAVQHAGELVIGSNGLSSTFGARALRLIKAVEQIVDDQLLSARGRP
jgi:hypothetical protein